MEENRPLVSFVIPAYRSRRTIVFTLKSILGQESPSSREIIVVDSSEESIADWLRGWFPTVRVVQTAQRLYPGAARNLGVRHARGDFLAFLDADTVAEPNWLSRMESVLSERPGVRLVGGWIGNANRRSMASRILHWIEFSEFIPGSRSRPVEFLSSANLFLSRDTFEACGGFPDDVPASEDRLFCERIGGGIHFEGSTGVLHYHRTRWREVSRHLRHLGYWGGRMRAARVGRGQRLRHFPLAGHLLGPYRTGLIALRIMKANPGQAAHVLLGLPLLAWGSQVWAAGFVQGLKTTDPDSRV